MMSIIYRWLAGIAIVLVIMLGSAWKGYHEGVEHQKQIYVAAQTHANQVVETKNGELQKLSDDQAKTQIVYKDRIVTQYQTITKEVVKYEKSPDAAIGLDPEFVRLHNSAASANGQIQIAEPTSGVGGEAGTARVTTGDAIGVITRNYQRYQACTAQVTGWQEFYTKLQGDVNK